MKITTAVVERVAVLAKLRLGADEISKLTPQLSAVLDYVGQLARLDTTAVDPFRHEIDSDPALRNDAVTNHPDPEALLSNAPDRDGTFFKVPRILE